MFSSVGWKREHLHFRSGASCYVFHEPKLIFFLGDGGTDEVFDRIGGISGGTFSANGFGVSTSGTRSDSIEIFSSKTQRGKTTMQFLDGKHIVVLSHRGTKLTLADGREFTLDGKTSLWLRCKSDGTIEHLNELPKGFVEYFESPPPGAIEATTISSEMFQK